MMRIQSKPPVAVAMLAGLLAGCGILAYPPLAITRGQEPTAPRAVSQPDGQARAPASGPEWRERAMLRAHKDKVNAVAISADGKLLASGGQDSNVILWDRASGKVSATLHGHKQPVSCVAFSPDGTLVASGSSGLQKRVGEVKLWNVASGKEGASFKLGDGGGPVLSIAISSDGTLLAACGDLGRDPGPDAEDKSFGVVTVWDLATGKAKVTFKEDVPKIGDDGSGPAYAPLPINSVAFSPDGKLLLTSSTNEVRVRSLATGKDVLTLEEKDKSPAPSGALAAFIGAAFSPDGKTIATAHTRAGVKLWDAQTGKERSALAKPEGEEWFLGNALVFPRDGSTLVTLRSRHQVKDGFHVLSGEVNLWDTSTGNLRQRLPAERLLTSTALSRDGKTLVVGSAGNVKVKADPVPADKGIPEPVGDKRGVVSIWQLED
jgi:WD40 repeat protein